MRQSNILNESELKIVAVLAQITHLWDRFNDGTRVIGTTPEGKPKLGLWCPTKRLTFYQWTPSIPAGKYFACRGCGMPVLYSGRGYDRKPRS